jgi:hypothetical protein
MPRHTPRLADFRFHDKSSLVSMVVIRGAVRAFDFAIVVALGLRGQARSYVQLLSRRLSKSNKPATPIRANMPLLGARHQSNQTLRS